MNRKGVALGGDRARARTAGACRTRSNGRRRRRQLPGASGDLGHRRTGGGTDLTIDLEINATLEVLDRRAGAASKVAVDAQTRSRETVEALLQRLDGRALCARAKQDRRKRRRRGRRGRRGRRSSRWRSCRRGCRKGGAGVLADDAVGVDALAALEITHGLLGAATEVAVDLQGGSTGIELHLQLANRRTLLGTTQGARRRQRGLCRAGRGQHLRVETTAYRRISDGGARAGGGHHLRVSGHRRRRCQCRRLQCERG